MTIRKLILAELERYLERRKEEASGQAAEASVQDVSSDGQKQTGRYTTVTHLGNLEWPYGERLSAASPLFASLNPGKKKARAKRTISATDPLRLQVMACYGRLLLSCTKTTKSVCSHQYLRGADVKAAFYKQGAWAKVEGVVFRRLAEVVQEHQTRIKARVPQRALQTAMVDSVTTLAYSGTQDKAESYWVDAAVAAILDSPLQVTEPKFNLEDIKVAYREYISRNEMKPFDYDYEAKVDLLEELDASA